MTQVFIDADACPVKEETYRVARRNGLKVFVVSNSRLTTPSADWIEAVVVKGGELDAADDWIAEQSTRGDVVVTTDIPLASRCLENHAEVISPTGRVFTEDMIGEALASREVQSHLREVGIRTGGPPPFGRKDRSRFLQVLEEAIRRAKRA